MPPRSPCRIGWADLARQMSSPRGPNARYCAAFGADQARASPDRRSATVASLQARSHRTLERMRCRVHAPYRPPISPEHRIEVEGSIETLQFGRAWVAEAEGPEPPGERVYEGGSQDLSTECERADTRCDGDGSSIAIVGVTERFAYMQPDAHANRQPGKPPAEPLAEHQTCPQRERSRREGEHEAVAQRLHHEAAMLLRALAHQAIVP